MQWNVLCAQVQRSGDPTLILDASTGRQSPYLGPGFQLELGLWILASRSKRLLERLPQLSRTDATLFQSTSGQSALFRCYQLLQELLDPAFPILLRLEKFSRIFEEIHAVLGLNHVLLVQLAAARALIRLHQPEFGRYFLASYRALSRHLIGHADVLGMDDIEIDTPLPEVG